MHQSMSSAVGGADEKLEIVKEVNHLDDQQQPRWYRVKQNVSNNEVFMYSIRCFLSLQYDSFHSIYTEYNQAGCSSTLFLQVSRLFYKVFIILASLVAHIYIDTNWTFSPTSKVETGSTIESYSYLPSTYYLYIFFLKMNCDDSNAFFGALLSNNCSRK